MATPYDQAIGPTQGGGFNPQAGGGFGQEQMMALLMKLLAPQPQATSGGTDMGSLLAQLRNDPVGDRNRNYAAGTDNAANPFANGFFQNSAADMTPEARLASQGRSAANQWGQLGQLPGVDAGKLTALMGQMTPTPGPAATPDAMTSDPYFQRRMDRMFGERTDLPKPAFDMTPDYLQPYLAAPTLRKGNVAGDGQQQYKRSSVPSRRPGMLGSPKSGFRFGM